MVLAEAVPALTCGDLGADRQTAGGGLARDQRGQQQVAGWQAKYQERAQRHQERGLSDLALSEFRWLLEEYRISLFCQELRTVVPVSERRLEESWSRVIE